MVYKIQFIYILSVVFLYSCSNDTNFKKVDESVKIKEQETEEFTASQGSDKKNIVQGNDSEAFISNTGINAPSPAISNELIKVSDKFYPQNIKKSQAVDIILLVDTSGSMKDEKKKVEDNLHMMINQFYQNYKDLDYQFYLVGEGFSFPNISSNRFHQINITVASTNALKIFLALTADGKFYESEANSEFLNEGCTITLSGITVLTPQVLQNLQSQCLKNKPFSLDDIIISKSGSAFRDASVFKEVIVISDDNSSLSVENFSTELKKLQNQKKIGKLAVNGVVGLSTSIPNAECEIASNGDVYDSLSKSSTYKGNVFDLCKSDWSELFSDLGVEVAAKQMAPKYCLSKTAGDSLGLKIKAYYIDGTSEVVDSKLNYDKASNCLLGNIALPLDNIEHFEFSYDAQK